MNWDEAIEEHFKKINLKEGSYFTEQQRQYHLVSMFRAKQTLALFSFLTGKKKFKKLKVFEPGCGVGPSSILFSKMGAFAVGCDIRRDFIKLAKTLNKIEKGKAHFLLADCLKMPFKENIFDCAFLWDVLEHTSKQKNMLKSVFHTLAYGGIFFAKISNKLFPIEPHTLLPFLTYIPKKYSDAYIKTFRRGFYAWYDSYEEIHLPTYGTAKRWFDGLDDRNVKFYQMFLHYIPFVGMFGMKHNIISFKLPNFLKRIFRSRKFLNLVSKWPFIIFAKDWLVVAVKS